MLRDSSLICKRISKEIEKDVLGCLTKADLGLFTIMEKGMSLCGFLAPDGTFTECDSWEHMQTAENIAKEKYNRTFRHSYEAEQYLYEVGYVGFYARAVTHTWVSQVNRRIILLTDVQKDFVIDHLARANNNDQKKSMEDLLKWSDEYQEDSILSHYESKIQD